MIRDSFRSQVEGLLITAGVTENSSISSSDWLWFHTDMQGTEFAMLKKLAGNVTFSQKAFKVLKL